LHREGRATNPYVYERTASRNELARFDPPALTPVPIGDEMRPTNIWIGLTAALIVLGGSSRSDHLQARNLGASPSEGKSRVAALKKYYNKSKRLV
jgi:hypothetical protein